MPLSCAAGGAPPQGHGSRLVLAPFRRVKPWCWRPTAVSAERIASEACASTRLPCMGRVHPSATLQLLAEELALPRLDAERVEAQPGLLLSLASRSPPTLFGGCADSLSSTSRPMTVECAVELHPQGSRAGGVRERLFTGFCVCCAIFGPDSQRYVQPPDEPPADQSVPLVEHWPPSLDDWRLTVSGSMADGGGIGGAAALGLRRHLWLSCGDGRLTRAPLLRVKGALG